MNTIARIGAIEETAPVYRIRPANPADAEFLAAAMVDAARSGAPHGLWDYVLPDDDTRIRILTAVANAHSVSFCHHRWFLVLESDNQPVATIAGFRPRDSTPRLLFDALTESMGPDALAAWKRFAALSRAFPPADPDDWVIEWLSVAADARGTGAGKAALEAVMQAGRDAGCRWAQGNAFTSNPAIVRLYQGLGFEFSRRCLDAEFEAATGAAGIDAYRIQLSVDG